MSFLTWQQNDKIYMAPILKYTAVLSEQAGHQFTAQIQDHNQSVLREWEGNNVEFNEVEQWVIFSAVDLEQSGSNEVMMKRKEVCFRHLIYASQC